MEYLIKTIENAAAEKGSVAALEAALDLPKKTLYEVKAGRRGLPIEACFKLAEITGADLVRVIAESEAITAKKPEKVEFWKKKLEALATSLFFGLVILNMSPTPAQASEIKQVIDYQCILCQIAALLKQRFLQAFKVRIPETLSRFLVPRVDHMTT